MKFAFAGLRHAHIFAMYNAVKNADDHDIVASFEDHQETCQTLADTNAADVTHHDFDEMLSAVDCDIVAIGDYYGRRGALAIKALKAGKHVIADKPICTSLAELEEIEALSKQNNLKIGCMLDVRDAANFIGLRNAVRKGDIGDVVAVSFGGQHPLMIGSRPNWYFEDGKHGGTINDIAIHAIDIIPWISGHKFIEISAAKTWNSPIAAQYPKFNDAAQVMMTLDNGCGVMGDVSYTVPNSLGYGHPLYWRMTIWGSKGVVETSYAMKHLSLAIDGDKEFRQIPLPESTPNNYLACFINDINGHPDPDNLNTSVVLESSRNTLLTQQAADSNLTNVLL